MTPVMSSSTINISLIPGCSFGTRKNHSLRRCYNLRKPTKRISYAQDLILPLSTSLRSFPNIRSYHLRHRPSFGIVSASGVDVDVDVDVDEVKQPDSDDLDEESGPTLEAPSSVDTSNNEESSTKPKQQSRTVRKSDMPPVKNEDLVPGATFTGKVRSIQPYGAFIDIGAFTNGLVHVSMLSDEFVKNVADVVSIGQEVQVTLVEANIETGRISLTMRDSGPTSGGKESRPPRYSQKSNQTRDEERDTTNRYRQKSNQTGDEERGTTKFAIGEILDGVVKELTNAGALVTLPKEEEGYLPLSEVADEGTPVEGSTTLVVGQEVQVQVLRVNRDQLTLTTRIEEDVEALESNVNGIKHEDSLSSFYTGENPFLVAFYKNEDIAAFLDEKEKTEGTAEVHEDSSSVPSLVEDKVDQQSQKLIEVKSGGYFNETETSSPLTGEKVEAEIESISGEAQLQTSGGMIEISSLLLNDYEKAEPVPDEKSSITSEEHTQMPDEERITTALIQEQVQMPVEERLTTPLIQDEVPEPATEETSNITSSDKQVDTPGTQESTIKDGKVEAVTERISREAQLQTSGEENEISSRTPDEDDKVKPFPDEKSSITSEEQLQQPVEESTTLPFIQDDISEPASEETNSITGSNEQVDASVILESTIEVEDGRVEVVAENVSSEAQLQTSGEENEISSQTPVEDDKAEPFPDETSTITSEEQLQIPVEESSTLPLVQDDIPEPASEVTSSITSLNEQVDAPVIQESIIECSPSYSSTCADKAEPFPDETSTITSEEQLQIPVEESSTLPLVQDDISEPAPAETSSITSLNEQVDAPVIQESIIEETQTTETLENQLEEITPEVEMEAEMLPATPVEDESVGVTAEQNGSITSTNGESNAASPSEKTAKATISPALVKQLREETGAGMMDCKKALAATEGDLIKAQEYLRKKGLASADKKASRATAEGRIGSYIHDSRIGVLIEVNCETDFVSRGDIFKELVNDLAMQVAACPQIEYLVPEDVPKEAIEKEKMIEMQREDLLSKPEQIRSKIVEGRIKKRLDELALLEQPYIKDDKVVVKDFVKSTIATIGENIKVKRFARFNLGEGLEKKTQDFAAEVAAQTSAKPISAPAKEQRPSATEANETAEPPKAAISAALVKQLREETGAGMMDCKKALSETGGDLEKAQEYLRKKGLLTADKKSGRLAAEGRIRSYIHDSRIGVLIEVNCETDFVGRSEKFKELVDDLAMQVVACPRVEYVSIEDIPVSIMNKEKEIEMQREDILSKPENIREKIVEGRVSKRLGEIALLEQPYLKDDSILVKDLVKQTVAAIGENIKVRRFIRFTLGESSESKSEETES